MKEKRVACAVAVFPSNTCGQTKLRHVMKPSSLLQQVGRPYINTEQHRGFLVSGESASKLELTLTLTRFPKLNKYHMYKYKIASQAQSCCNYEICRIK